MISAEVSPLETHLPACHSSYRLALKRNRLLNNCSIPIIIILIRAGRNFFALPHPVERLNTKRKRGAVTPFLYGGRRNYLVLRRCNKPTLIRESHHTRSVALWNFLRSHTQNKRKRFVDFLPKSAAKLHKYFHIQKSFSFMSEKVRNFAACKPQNLRLINRTTI